MTYEETLDKYAQRFSKGKVKPGSTHITMHSDRGSGCNTCDFGAKGEWMTLAWKAANKNNPYQTKDLGDDIARVLADLLEISERNG